MLSKTLSLLAIGLALVGSALPVRATLITNGGFEDNSLSDQGANWQMSTTAAPGWHTTQPDGKIELWTDGFYGVSAYEGEQFIEINANEQATVFQDVTGLLKGLELDFSFAHRARSTNESIRFSITDLGADGLYGTADDTSLFSQVYTDGTAAWGSYSGSVTTTSTNAVRFSFESLTPGSWGNFLDAVQIGATATNAPEPGTWAAIVILAGAAFSSGAKSMIRRLATARR